MSNDYFTQSYSAVTLTDGVTATAALWNPERTNVEASLDAVEAGFDILPAPYDQTGTLKGFDAAIYVGAGSEDEHALRKSQVIDEIAAAAIGGGSIDAILKWVRKSANYTCANYDWVLADTSGGAWELKLPASPADGNQIWVMDGGNAFHTYNLTVNGNGETIEGSSTFTCNRQSQYVVFVYHGGDSDWKAAWAVMGGPFQGHYETVRTFSEIDADDADAICLAQSLGGAGNLTLNGAKTTGGTSWTFNQGRKISITSTGDDSGVDATITGTNALTGASDTETLDLTNASVAVSTKYWSAGTQIALDGATDGNVTAGQQDAVFEIDFQYGVNKTTVSADVGAFKISNAPPSGYQSNTLVKVLNGGAQTWPDSYTGHKTDNGDSLAYLFTTTSTPSEDWAVASTDDAGSTIVWTRTNQNVSLAA